MVIGSEFMSISQQLGEKIREKIFGSALKMQHAKERKISRVNAEWSLKN